MQLSVIDWRKLSIHFRLKNKLMEFQLFQIACVNYTYFLYYFFCYAYNKYSYACNIRFLSP